MDYENFKEQFVEDVKERLYEQGTEVDITVNTVNRLNESYEAMTVKPEGRASILATNQMIENMGVTPEQLHADALENVPRIKPAEIKGMGEVLAEMMEVEQAEMMGLYPVDLSDAQIFVASVPDKVHGAGVLAYQDFMDQAAERAGGECLGLRREDLDNL